MTRFQSNLVKDEFENNSGTYRNIKSLSILFGNLEFFKKYDF
jgi:hypothetical protein